MIEISVKAQSYLKDLLSQQEDDDVGIRVFVSDPGTPSAEACIAYCRPGEEEEGDIPVDYDGFRAWFEARSEPFLQDAEVDYQEDTMGGQLTIKAPNSRVPNIKPDSPIEDKVNYFLQSEINPGLAAHGGMVSLIEITEEKSAVLQFGGGCQGCAAVDVTLKNSVEATLLERVPELSGVLDLTDHSNNENAYFT